MPAWWRDPRPSLRLRLAMAGLVALAAALVIAFFGLSLLFERHVERRVAAELTLHLDQMIANLGFDQGRLRLAREPTDPRFSEPQSGLYWQIQSTGTMLRSRSLWDAELDLPPLDPGRPVSRTIEGPAGGSLLLIEREIVGSRRLDNRKVLLAVAVIRTDIEAATAAFRRDMLPYLALLGLLFIAAAAFQIQIGLRPLTTLRRKVAEIRRGSEQRIGDSFPSEVLPLTREVDELLASREMQLKRARDHAADFAHGLKTPLQALTGDIARLRERGEDRIADDIQSLAGLMRRHIDHQLARARMAGRPTGNSDVGASVRRLVSVLERTPLGGMIEWNVQDEGARARIDAEDLTETLGNILDNAMRYAHEMVTIDIGRRDGRVSITVLDDGPGIPADKLDHVLRRGGRLDETSGGAGLGLAIAHDIVTAAGGTLALENATPGLSVTMLLPPADQ